LFVIKAWEILCNILCGKSSMGVFGVGGGGGGGDKTVVICIKKKKDMVLIQKTIYFPSPLSA